MPFLPLLGLLFVALKLTGHIAWSWLWVLAPFWGVPAVMLLVVLLSALGLGTALLPSFIRLVRQRRQQLGQRPRR